MCKGIFEESYLGSEEMPFCLFVFLLPNLLTYTIIYLMWSFWGL